MRPGPLAVVVLVLLTALAGCRRHQGQASSRISEFAEVQHYTLVGPLIPIGLPFGDGWVRIDLRLENAREASGSLHLRKDGDWERFGTVGGNWDGSVMTLLAEDGQGNAARFELAFSPQSARGTALIFWRLRRETTRYGADLGYE